MNHTPGPWTYEVRDGDNYIIDAEGGSLQCDMQYYPWVSSNDADWHLMATAPEMLEALEKARNQLDANCFTDEPLEACLTRVNAALRKATGEQR